MANKPKRLMCLLLALIIVLGFAPAVAAAGETDTYPNAPGRGALEIDSDGKFFNYGSPGHHTFGFSYESVVDVTKTNYTYEEMLEDMQLLVQEYSKAAYAGSLYSVEMENLTEGDEAGTVLGRDIYALKVGSDDAPYRFLIVGAISGRDYMTSQFLMRDIESFLANYNRSVNGEPMKDLLARCQFFFVPMLNPDGVMLSQQGLKSLDAPYLTVGDKEREDIVAKLEQMAPEMLEALDDEALKNALDGVDSDWKRPEPTSDDAFEYWESNINGVDLNYNFVDQEMWDWLRQSGTLRDYPAYTDKPAFKKYMGAKGYGDPSITHIDIQPETRALMDYCAKYRFNMTFNYKTVGNATFWNYGFSKESDGTERQTNHLAISTRLNAYLDNTLSAPEAIPEKESFGFMGWYLHTYNSAYGAELTLGNRSHFVGNIDEWKWSSGPDPKPNANPDLHVGLTNDVAPLKLEQLALDIKKPESRTEWRRSIWMKYKFAPLYAAQYIIGDKKGEENIDPVLTVGGGAGPALRLNEEVTEVDNGNGLFTITAIHIPDTEYRFNKSVWVNSNPDGNIYQVPSGTEVTIECRKKPIPRERLASDVTTLSFHVGGGGELPDSTFTAIESTCVEVENSVIDTTKAKYSYDEMMADIDALKAAYPGKIRVNPIGKTVLGRKILAIIIGKENAPNRYLGLAGTHAREYVGSMLLMKNVEYFLHNWDNTVNGQPLRELFEQCQFTFIPMHNPDGVMLSQNSLASLYDDSVTIDPGSRDEIKAKLKELAIDMSADNKPSERDGNLEDPAATIDSPDERDENGENPTVTIDSPDDDFDFTYWKSNVNGVDLQNNIVNQEMWELLKLGTFITNFDKSANYTIEGNNYMNYMGIDDPAYENLSDYEGWELQPESSALMDYCLKNRFNIAVTYHATGNIYQWNYGFMRESDGTERQILHHLISARLAEYMGHELVPMDNEHYNAALGFTGWYMNEMGNAYSACIELGHRGYFKDVEGYAARGNDAAPLDIEQFTTDVETKTGFQRHSIWEKHKLTPIYTVQFILNGGKIPQVTTKTQKTPRLGTPVVTGGTGGTPKLITIPPVEGAEYRFGINGWQNGNTLEQEMLEDGSFVPLPDTLRVSIRMKDTDTHVRSGVASSVVIINAGAPPNSVAGPDTEDDSAPLSYGATLTDTENGQ